MALGHSYLTPRHDHDTESQLTTFSCSDGFSENDPADGPEDLYARGNDAFSITNQQRSPLTPESSTAHSPPGNTTLLEADLVILGHEPYDALLLRRADMQVNPTRNMSPETLRSGSDVSRTRSISSTNSSHSPLLPQASSSSSAYGNSPNSEAGAYISRSAPTSSAATPALPLLLRTANTMSAREKKRLLRSHRKLSKILGETPVLSTTIEASDVSLAMIDETHADPGRRRGTSSAAAGRRRTTVPIARHDTNNNGAQWGSLAAHHAPRMRRASSPAPTRSPPVLRIDTAASPNGKRPRPRPNTSPEADGDALSVISTTTTTTTMMLDRDRETLLHPHRSHSRVRRSPLSPASPQSLLSTDGEAERAKEKKRAKMAKLARHLGENVPSELVFPVALPKRSSSNSPMDSALPARGAESKSLSVEAWSTNVAKSFAPRKQSGDVCAPPRRSSLIKRKKRISLSLDFYHWRSIQPTGTPKTDGARAIFQSNSLKYPEHERLSEATLSAANETFSRDQKGLQCIGEDVRKDQIPISDRQRLVNVRRAQKISRVFGAPPPSALLQGSNSRALSALDEEDVESVRRLKRHSFHSIISAISEQTERTAVARDGTPSTFMSGGGIQQNLNQHRAGSESFPSTKRTHKRGHSLTDVPPTPPPFSRYFHTALSVSPRESTSTISSNAAPQTPSPTVGGLPIGPPMPLTGRPRQLHHRHSPSSPSALSVRSPYTDHSPKSPHSPYSLTSSVSSSSVVGDKLRPVSPTHGLGPGSGSFAARRDRATKLTRFFGVAYSELFPTAAVSSPVLGVGAGMSSPLSPSICTSSQIDITLEGKGTAGKSSSRTRLPLSLRPMRGGEREQWQGAGKGYMRVDQEAALKSPLEGVSVVVQRDVWHDQEYAPGSMAPRGAHAYVRRGTIDDEIDARKRSSEEANITLGRSKRDASMLEVLEKLRELK